MAFVAQVTAAVAKGAPTNRRQGSAQDMLTGRQPCVIIPGDADIHDVEKCLSGHNESRDMSSAAVQGG
jgi:hypothetical protein